MNEEFDMMRTQDILQRLYDEEIIEGKTNEQAMRKVLKVMGIVLNEKEVSTTAGKQEVET